MKLITAFVIGSLSLALGSNAFADTAGASKTRAQVNAELVHAEATGMLPASKVHYPNDADVRHRNQVLYRITHGAES